MKKHFLANAYTCIVPFYNEGERVLHVLSVLTKVKNLATIICVDDGSKDDAYRKIQKRYPEVIVIRSEKNQGKASAVYKGLLKTQTEYVLLIDADLQHLKKHEIEHAIRIMKNDKRIDMLILKRETDPWFAKLVRAHITATGERILRTEDLLKAYHSKPKKYQLEFAIDFYMVEQHKQVYWVHWTAQNTLKTKKIGMLKGITADLAMYFHMTSFGYIKTCINIATFCRNEYPGSLT